jgi:hypothetical protein
MANTQHITQIYDKSGDSKAFVATIVANVATEGMRLDSTDLHGNKNS